MPSQTLPVSCDSLFSIHRRPCLSPDNAAPNPERYAIMTLVSPALGLMHGDAWAGRRKWARVETTVWNSPTRLVWVETNVLNSPTRPVLVPR